MRRRELHLLWIVPSQEVNIQSSPAIVKAIRFTLSQIKIKLEQSNHITYQSQNLTQVVTALNKPPAIVGRCSDRP
jgi:hypothetical protein